MLARSEVPLIDAHQIDDQEDRADQNVEAVEARRHVEGRAVGAAAERERRVHIFIGLDRREEQAEDHRQPQAGFQTLTISMN